jgi:hypothetical protein
LVFAGWIEERKKIEGEFEQLLKEEVANKERQAPFDFLEYCRRII